MSTSPIQKALQAALEGPEKQRLKVYGHHWNVKPAHVRREGPRVVVEGQLDHSVRFTFDDHFFYEFVFQNGELTKKDIRFEEGGWGQIAGPIASAVGAYFGKPIPPDDVEKIGNKLENIAHGDWKNAIQKLALRIGLEGYKRMHSITAYTQPGFNGTSQSFAPGVYEADDFWAVGNDRIASIEVPPRMKVLVCRHRPGVGRPEECKMYTEEMPELDKEVMGVSYLSVEDQDNPSHDLVIDGTDAGRTEYTVTVSGWMRKNARQGSVQRSDQISDDWTTAHGEVTGGTDAYTFTGEVETVDLEGDAENTVVTVDGRAIEAVGA